MYDALVQARLNNGGRNVRGSWATIIEQAGVAEHFSAEGTLDTDRVEQVGRRLIESGAVTRNGPGYLTPGPAPEGATHRPDELPAPGQRARNRAAAATPPAAEPAAAAAAGDSELATPTAAGGRRRSAAKRTAAAGRTAAKKAAAPRKAAAAKKTASTTAEASTATDAAGADVTAVPAKKSASRRKAAGPAKKAPATRKTAAKKVPAGGRRRRGAAVQPPVEVSAAGEGVEATAAGPAATVQTSEPSAPQVPPTAPEAAPADDQRMPAAEASNGAPGPVTVALRAFHERFSGRLRELDGIAERIIGAVGEYEQRAAGLRGLAEEFPEQVQSLLRGLQTEQEDAARR